MLESGGFKVMSKVEAKSQGQDQVIRILLFITWEAQSLAIE